MFNPLYGLLKSKPQTDIKLDSNVLAKQLHKADIEARKLNKLPVNKNMSDDFEQLTETTKKLYLDKAILLIEYMTEK